MRERLFSPFRVAGRTLAGVAVSYGRPIRREHYNLVIAPGAFGSPLPAVPLCLNHDVARELLAADQVALDDSASELRVRAEALDPDLGILPLVRDGTLSGFSIGFVYKWHLTESRTRLVSEATLEEISLVAEPADRRARAEVLSRVRSVAVPAWML